MSPCVINPFKVINVEEDHGKLFIANKRAARNLHAQVHLVAISKAGKGIKPCL